MNETPPPPQQDETKASGKASWIKPELICLNSDTAEGKGNITTTEVSVGSGFS